jgi:hypothetical protein
LASISVGPSPRRARSAACFITRHIATTSLPSTATPGMP